MINLMQRLAELDAKNPNIVKQPVSEVSVDYVANKVAEDMQRRQGVAEGSDQYLVYISKNKVREFEKWMESEGLETEVPKKDIGKFIVYNYSNADHTSKVYASEWNENEGVAEGSVFDVDTTGYTKNDMNFINNNINQIKKIRVKLLKIPGFARKINDETSQLQLAEKIFNLMKRGQTFDSALVLAQKQGVAEGSLNENMNKNQAIQTLSWLRDQGKKLESNPTGSIGQFANEVANYLYQVMQWLESNVPQSPKRDEYVNLMATLRKTAKSLEMSGEPNPRFANEVVNSLWPAMEWITSNVPQTQGVAEEQTPTMSRKGIIASLQDYDLQNYFNTLDSETLSDIYKKVTGASVSVTDSSQDDQQYGMQGSLAESLQECMDSMSQPRTPASINMTAASGEELSGMLRDIMQLAGRPMQEPMGSNEPVAGGDGIAVVDVEPAGEPEPEMGGDQPSIMRSMLDKLNPETDDDMDDEEEKVDEYGITGVDSTSADPTKPPPFDANQRAYQPNSPGAAIGRGLKDHPVAIPMEQKLMAEYREFVAEGDPYGERSKPGQHRNVSRDTLGTDLKLPLAARISQRLGVPGDVRGDARAKAGQPRSTHLRNIPQLPGESVEDGPDIEETYTSGYSLAKNMSLDDFVATYGEESRGVWYEAHPKEATLLSLEDMLKMAQKGVNIIDDIGDLNDLFDEVHNSGDQDLIDAYTMVRELDDEEDLDAQKQTLINAISMIKGGANESQDILRLAGLR